MMTRAYMVSVMEAVVAAARDESARSWRITQEALDTISRFDLPWPDDVAELFGKPDDTTIGPVITVMNDKRLLAHKCLLPFQNDPYKSSEPRSRKKAPSPRQL